MINENTPQQTVDYLDQYIIGQKDAKKAVAIALRNRARRMALGEDPIKDEIHPKNIIMIGPTGVGKTEIARRLARMVKAPFIKVEATKYTEVGYVGRDVESMIRDLANEGMKMVRDEHEKQLREKAEKNVEERILDILLEGSTEEVKSENTPEDGEIREMFRRKLVSGQLEDREIEIRAPQSQPVMQIMAAPGMEDFENQMQGLLGDMFPKRKEARRLQIRDARKILTDQELEKLIDHEKIRIEAVERVEQQGIVFIDEIDKIVSQNQRGSGEVSREGVQRDILPLVEGSTVNTRYGSVRTDHVLFIAAGAFQISSVQDLIPELQGRFPIRVELKPLNKKDFRAILQNTRNALSKQYTALLSTEGVVLNFTAEGYEAIAEIAEKMNEQNENIGARRLHTILERMLEDVSFQPDKYKSSDINIDRSFVEGNLDEVTANQDLSRYIL